MHSEPNLHIKSFTELTSPGAQQARQVFDTIFPRLQTGGHDEFSDILGYKDSLGFVATDAAGAAVGMALLSLHDPTIAQLEHFGILPNWRRQRFGSALLHFIEMEAMKAGRQYLKLRSIRAALPFYYSVDNGYQFSASHGPMTELCKKLTLS